MAKAFTVGLLAGGAMYWSLSSNLWETRQRAAKKIAEVHAGVQDASRLNEVRFALRRPRCTPPQPRA